MIILLGFPKSGTSSFQHMFMQLGYNSYHQVKDKKNIGILIQKNKKNKKPLLSDFLKTDCITQLDVCCDKKNAYWPQLTDYVQLYEENTDAIFILNKRNPLDILSSFKRWKYKNISYFDRFHMYNPELFNGTDNKFIEIVKNHYETIENFFKLRPYAKFISYDIDVDTIEKLSSYIDVSAIDVFPKINVNQM